MLNPTFHRPINKNLGVTALKASEAYLKVPYYVPGTKEIGEFWVEPKITDEGYLRYNFKFLDPKAEFGTVVETIVVDSEQLLLIAKGLNKVVDWTGVAQQNNVRRRLEKSAVCFPQADCAEKVLGNSSTEIIFLTYEDGSTAGQIRRNKGKSVINYNLSHQSADLLTAYIEYMHEVAELEYEISSTSNEELLELFE